MADPRTLAELSASYREAHPLIGQREFVFAGIPVRVESNSIDLLAELAEYWAEFRAGDEPDEPVITVTALEGDPPVFDAQFIKPPLARGKKRLKEAYLELEGGRVVHKVRTGMMFAFGGDENLGMGPCLDNPNQVINFVNNRIIHHVLRQGAELGHASAVRMGKKATVGIAGFSGMGKSTLALHLMSAAPLTFVSNDRVMFKRGAEGEPVHIWGVPKHPRINPGTALNNDDLGRILTDEEKAQFSRLAPEELWELEHKYDALVHECFGQGRFELEGDLVGFVVLNWRRDGGPAQVGTFSADERRDLLQAIMKSVGLFYEPGQAIPDPSEEACVAALADVPIIEIAGGVDFPAAVEAVLAHLRKHASDVEG